MKSLELMAKIFKVNVKRIDGKIIRKAVAALKKGGLVIFPTETVYGLAADPLNKKAVAKIFKAKKRPLNQPLQLLISDPKHAKTLATKIPIKVNSMMKRFWPGPLTIVVKKKRNIPDIVTGGLNTVGIRVPDHDVALELIKAFGRPIAATSANLSGKKPPKTAKEAAKYLKGKVDFIIDSGKTKLGKASKVIDATAKTIKTLRK